jgi:hypothetical protein
MLELNVIQLQSSLRCHPAGLADQEDSSNVTQLVTVPSPVEPRGEAFSALPTSPNSILIERQNSPSMHMPIPVLPGRAVPLPELCTKGKR